MAEILFRLKLYTIFNIRNALKYFYIILVVRRIIFANPAKMASHIRYASAVGVDCMTFDSETELIKIKQYMPHAK